MTPSTRNQFPNDLTTPAPRSWLIATGFLVAGWLIVLGAYSWRTSTAGSPDEAGNRFIATQVATTGAYQVPVPFSASQLEVYRPRSLAHQDGTLTSGSFLGFVQIQALALRTFGQSGPVALTLIFFAGALVALYRIGRRYWEWPWALLACGLLATMPPVAIFNTLPWHHAALFTSALVLTGFVVLRFQEQQTFVRAIVIGLVYGVALLIRPVDVLFTGPALAVVMLVHRRGWLYASLTAATVLIVQLPWLIAGWQLFGSWLATGYTTTGISPVVSAAGQTGLAWWRIFVPPGGWSWHFFQAAWDGLLTSLPAVSAMAVISLIAYVRRKCTALKKIAKIGAVIAFVAYYIIYYGSLDLQPLSFSSVGFQISYIRYWLPLFAAMAAGVTVFLRGVSGLPRRLGVALGLAVIAVNASLSIWDDSGLIGQARRDKAQAEIQQRVLAVTEPASFIVAYNYDKVLLGQRLTSYRGPTNDAEWRILAQIRGQRPTYILVTPVSPPPDQLVTDAARHRLALERVLTVQDATLWRLAEEAGT